MLRRLLAFGRGSRGSRGSLTLAAMRRLLRAALLLAPLAACAAGSSGGAPPPAPDYRDDAAWLARPGDDGLERSTPAGLRPVDERTARADVFFLHPTSTLERAAPNAAIDAGAAIDRAVLANQASAFNACCRIYAPRYRQASLAALGHDHAADDLAYGDVAAAFDRFLAVAGPGRPFIVAGHSQGAGLALRLLTERIAPDPALRRRLVAAYLVGAFVPADMAGVGVPACATGSATGCAVSWNTSAGGAGGARLLLHDATFRADGRWRHAAGRPALCVDPLDWTIGGRAPPEANRGSLPLRMRGGGLEGTRRVVLPDPVPGLTGAACAAGGALVVHVSPRAPAGFHDLLAWLTGSYHLEDYNLFWTSIRENAVERVTAAAAEH